MPWHQPCQAQNSVFHMITTTVLQLLTSCFPFFCNVSWVGEEYRHLMAEHPTSYLLCFGQLHISVITSEHCKKKLLWSKLTAVWYRNKHSCLDGNLVGRFCLLQHVGHMEAWLFHDTHVCVHAWHLAVEVKLTAQHPSVYRTTPNSKQLSIL